MKVRFKTNERLDLIVDYKKLDSRKKTINTRRDFYCETKGQIMWSKSK